MFLIGTFFKRKNDKATKKIVFSNKRTMNYQSMVYNYPYTRIAPYLVGLVLGYILIHKLTLHGNYTRVSNTVLEIVVAIVTYVTW